MRVRLGSIVALIAAGAMATVIGLWLVDSAHADRKVDALVAEGASAAVVQFGGTLLALATTLFVLHLERRHREHELAAELADAHRRVADEVREVMRSASSLLKQWHTPELTLLPDDVWRNARRLLTSAHSPAHDPLDYALTDFYTRVNVLQLSDRIRVNHLLQGGSPEDADVLVRRDAVALAPLGEHLLAMLHEADRHVGTSARSAIVQD